jgi:thymidine phosphorylase
MGSQQAELSLAGGSAWRKFQAICEAQGGMRSPPKAAHTDCVCAERAGRVVAIDNRRLARAAKLAGAPKAPAAGIEFLAPLGTPVEQGQPLFVLHAEAHGELHYALDYVNSQPGIVVLGETR